MEDDEVNWKEHFPIYQTEDFDLSFPNLLVPLGLKSTTPKELIKRIIAAAISYHAQYRSIDYAFKKYVQWREYDTNDGSRLDVRISRAIGEGSDQFHSLIYHVATLPPKSLGNVISELTLMRVPHAIRQLLTLAHRGCLYEACAVGRMILEQIAWAANIDSLRDKESIISKKAEDSISYLKRIIPSAGRLYGWLSTHTHWRYDGHVKALNL